MLLEKQTRYFHLTDFKRRENGFQVYPHLKTNIFKKIPDVVDINLKDVKKSTRSRLLSEL